MSASPIESRIANGLSRFSVSPCSLDWVSNYERTRWFLVLRVTKPTNDNLNRLLSLSNRSLAHFGQPSLYAGNPASPVHRLGRHENIKPHTQPEELSHCFHVSLAWSLIEPTTEQKERIDAVDIRRLRILSIHFDCVKVKIGNNISSIPLSTVQSFSVI